MPAGTPRTPRAQSSFSALQRAEIAEIHQTDAGFNLTAHRVSVLFNEPKLLKFAAEARRLAGARRVSVLFNEPKLLKSSTSGNVASPRVCFSALQRAEIAEIAGDRR